MNMYSVLVYEPIDMKVLSGIALLTFNKGNSFTSCLPQRYVFSALQRLISKLTLVLIAFSSVILMNVLKQTINTSPSMLE